MKESATPRDRLLAGSGEKQFISDDQAREFMGTGLVTVTNQIIGSGKSTVIKGLAATTAHRKPGEIRFVKVPSSVTRQPRDHDGETEGDPYYFKTEAELAKMLEDGLLLEYENNGTLGNPRFYATDIPGIQTALAESPTTDIPVKDVETKGALSLREINPSMPIIIPAPFMRPTTRSGRTIWEDRFSARDGDFEEMNEQKRIDTMERLRTIEVDFELMRTSGLFEDDRALMIINQSREYTNFIANSWARAISVKTGGESIRTAKELARTHKKPALTALKQCVERSRVILDAQG